MSPARVWRPCGGVVGLHAPEDPFERPCPSSTGPETGRHRGVGRVHQDRETGGEHDGCAVDGQAHGAIAAVARLVRESLAQRGVADGAQEPQLPGRRGAGESHGEGVGVPWTSARQHRHA